MASSGDGIKKLMEAEKKAAECVAIARKGGVWGELPASARIMRGLAACCREGAAVEVLKVSELLPLIVKPPPVS